MSLYKIHKANFVNYSATVKIALTHMLGRFSRLAAKKDTHTGTFPLFSSIRNEFNFPLDLYWTKDLKHQASEKYVRKFFDLTYEHTAARPTEFFTELFNIKEHLDWIGKYPVDYASLCDRVITSMSNALDVCDMDDLEISWAKEVALHKWTNAALWNGLKNHFDVKLLTLWKRHKSNGSNIGTNSVANRVAKLEQHIETGLDELGQRLQTLQEEGIPSIIGDETMSTGTFCTRTTNQPAMFSAAAQ